MCFYIICHFNLKCEDQVQELVLGGGSQLVVTEVRKSKLFILLGLVDMTDRSMSRLKVIPRCSS